MIPSKSHVQVLLWLARQYPIRTVLELGPGDISTPVFLREFPHLTRLVSLEDNVEYAIGLVYEDPRWELKIVPSVSEAVAVCDLDYDLILVDNDTTVSGRVQTIRTLADRVPRGFVVIHDFERVEYREASVPFPHRLVIDTEPQHVAVLGYRPVP